MLSLSREAAALVAPMPASFAPSFTDDGRLLRWEASVQVGTDTLKLRAGLRYGAAPLHPRAEALALLRASAWQLLEAARLGWAHKLAPFRHDRHRAAGRPVSIPQWTPRAEDLKADGG